MDRVRRSEPVVGKHSKGKRSQKQERDTAERYGGRVNSQSGAGWVRKNDVTTPTSSIECKYTEKASYSLKVKDLIKAWIHATQAGRRMVFAVEFMETPSNQYTRRQRYVVLTEDDYLVDQAELALARDEIEHLRVTIGDMREAVANCCDRPGGCI